MENLIIFFSNYSSNCSCIVNYSKKALKIRPIEDINEWNTNFQTVENDILDKISETNVILLTIYNNK